MEAITSKHIELTSKQVERLPEGTKYLEDSEGRFYLSQVPKEMEKKKELARQIFIYEDLSAGKKIILESETEPLKRLIILGKSALNQFPKSNTLRRGYIG